MAEPRDPGRQLRDELLGLTAFDPADAVDAFVALEPEIEEPEPATRAELDESDPTGADPPPDRSAEGA